MSPFSQCHFLSPKPLLDILCLLVCAIPQKTKKKQKHPGCVVLASNLHTRILQVSPQTLQRHTDTLSHHYRRFSAEPTHWIVSGAALASRLCVGGTEPQALSVSIAHVKSHVGCDEPLTIPGTIAEGEGGFRRPPRKVVAAAAAWRRMPVLSSC